MQLSTPIKDAIIDLSIEAGISGDDLASVKAALGRYLADQPRLRQHLINATTRSIADPDYMELFLSHLDDYLPDLPEEDVISDDLEERVLRAGPNALNDADLAWLAISASQLEYFYEAVGENMSSFWVNAINDAMVTAACENGQVRLSSDELARKTLDMAAYKLKHGTFEPVPDSKTGTDQDPKAGNVEGQTDNQLLSTVVKRGDNAAPLPVSLAEGISKSHPPTAVTSHWRSYGLNLAVAASILFALWIPVSRMYFDSGSSRMVVSKQLPLAVIAAFNKNRETLSANILEKGQVLALQFGPTKANWSIYLCDKTGVRLLKRGGPTEKEIEVELTGTETDGFGYVLSVTGSTPISDLSDCLASQIELMEPALQSKDFAGSGKVSYDSQFSRIVDRCSEDSQQTASVIMLQYK